MNTEKYSLNMGFENIRCPNCGKENGWSAKKCFNCDYPL